MGVLNMETQKRQKIENELLDYMKNIDSLTEDLTILVGRSVGKERVQSIEDFFARKRKKYKEIVVMAQEEESSNLEQLLTAYEDYKDIARHIRNETAAGKDHILAIEEYLEE